MTIAPDDLDARVNVTRETDDSLLAGLRARRERLAGSKTRDLRVPGWDEDGVEWRITVRKLHDEERVRAQKIGQGKDKDSEVMGSAYAIATATVKITMREGDDEAEFTDYMSELADALEVTQRRAAAVVRALFIADGDLITAANALTEWSGYGGGGDNDRAFAEG